MTIGRIYKYLQWMALFCVHRIRTSYVSILAQAIGTVPHDASGGADERTFARNPRCSIEPLSADDRCRDQA